MRIETRPPVVKEFAAVHDNAVAAGVALGDSLPSNSDRKQKATAQLKSFQP